MTDKTGQQVFEYHREPGDGTSHTERNKADKNIHAKMGHDYNQEDGQTDLSAGYMLIERGIFERSYDSKTNTVSIGSIIGNRDSTDIDKLKKQILQVFAPDLEITDVSWSQFLLDHPIDTGDPNFFDGGNIDSTGNIRKKLKEK